ncbi:MAG: hypothetical protein ACREBU_06280 [Nitrososphaera sp.]
MPNGHDSLKPLEKEYQIIAIDLPPSLFNPTDSTPSEARISIKKLIHRSRTLAKKVSSRSLIRVTYAGGLALGFPNNTELPIQLALEISDNIKKQQMEKKKARTGARIGLHSGPVARIKDSKGRECFFGSGIPIAIKIARLGGSNQILASGPFIDKLVETNPKHAEMIKNQVQWTKKRAYLPPVFLIAPQVD